jgi:septal ring factor EnvC (AmiA/AmiB activator)
MNLLEKIKTNWKTILLIVLAILFVSKCSSSGNYKRKYNKQVKYTEYVIDSMNTVYSNSSKYIDSLKNTIRLQDAEISSLTQQVNIYKDQNSQLNDRNKELANKKIIVNVEKETTE